MRIHRKQKNTKNIIIITAAVIVLSAFAYAWFSPAVPFFGIKNQVVQPENTVDYDESTDEQKTAGENQKKSTAKPNVDSKPIDLSVGSEPAVGNFDVTITALNQVDNRVQLRTLIGEVTDKGICTAVFQKAGATVTKTSDIAALPSSSTCKGFDVPVVELSSGEWQVTVTVDINGKSNSATQTIKVQQ